MKLLRAAYLTLIATLIAGTEAHAGGGGIVFDPTNWVQNTATAISTVKQEGISIQNAARLAQMMIDGRKMVQLREMGISDLAQAEQMVAQIGRLSGADDTLLQALGKKSDFIGDVMGLYGASQSGNFGSFVNGITQRAALGNANAANLINKHEALNQGIQVAQQKRLRIANEIGNVPGATQAIQVATAALDTLIEQNQLQSSAVSAQLASAAKKEAADTARAKAADQSVSDYANGIDQRLQRLGVK
ncbi:hypothetical protein [Cupriavidus basilensis]|uniref:hypothetical protein n=1 Tax=Cupriavidus basilensis TaxID=68895 RepID=UPI0020A64215|nr:hypothetical protein [Cupriavidus basilensis]MCP3023780.1 hypothetical protein [Cupriavidus basilensis]